MYMYTEEDDAQQMMVQEQQEVKEGEGSMNDKVRHFVCGVVWFQLGTFKS